LRAAGAVLLGGSSCGSGTEKFEEYVLKDAGGSLPSY
jgi:hypothetical protein